MRAFILERKNEAVLRDIDLPSKLGPGDVRIAMKVVGICGSDLHYYKTGAIGPFVVREPMVLGHEGSGVVTEVGAAVTHLAPGDRVCMEPGIPDWRSRATREGRYNLDPSLTFWATPPIHGCLTPEVVHPAELTFKLPEGVSFAEGAFVEPLAVGLQAARKARIEAGQVAVVVGAGTIGVLTALCALASGCSQVMITDVQPEKLKIAAAYDGVVAIDISKENAATRVAELTSGWGAEVLFEASGNSQAFAGMFDLVAPGGRVVLIGMPDGAAPLDVVAAQVKEVTIETVFRYANVYRNALALLASGRVDVKPLISRTFPFERSVEAFEFAAEGLPDVVKTQIAFD